MDYDDATELRQIARVASATPERVPFAILALVVCLELIIKYNNNVSDMYTYAIYDTIRSVWARW